MKPDILSQVRDARARGKWLVVAERHIRDLYLSARRADAPLSFWRLFEAEMAPSFDVVLYYSVAESIDVPERCREVFLKAVSPTPSPSNDPAIERMNGALHSYEDTRRRYWSPLEFFRDIHSLLRNKDLRVAVVIEVESLGPYFEKQAGLELAHLMEWANEADPRRHLVVLLIQNGDQLPPCVLNGPASVRVAITRPDETDFYRLLSRAHFQGQRMKPSEIPVLAKALAGRSAFMRDAWHVLQNATEFDMKMVEACWPDPGGPSQIRQDVLKRLSAVTPALKMRLIGQDEAAESIVEHLQIGALFQNRGPIATLLFAGPTGVGKTEAGRIIAEICCEGRLTLVNGEEYQEKHAAARFTGSPPGYVGYGDTPTLVKDMHENPFRVILFNEMEKAHRDVCKVFLGALDGIPLKTGAGEKIDLSRTILIFTTNAGADQAKGITNAGQKRATYLTAVRDYLLPEFIGRLGGEDAIVVFASLSPEVIARVVRKEVDARLHELATTHGIRTAVSDADIASLVGTLQVEYGVRDIQKKVKRHLARKVGQDVLAGLETKDERTERRAVGA